MLNGQLSDLADVVVTLFVTETGETKCRLSTTTVLLGEVDSELVDDLSCVAGNGTEKGAVTVHDDEAELGVRLEELLESLSVEFVVAKVKRAAIVIITDTK